MEPEQTQDIVTFGVALLMVETKVNELLMHWHATFNPGAAYEPIVALVIP